MCDKQRWPNTCAIKKMAQRWPNDDPTHKVNLTTLAQWWPNVKVYLSTLAQWWPYRSNAINNVGPTLGQQRPTGQLDIAPTLCSQRRPNVGLTASCYLGRYFIHAYHCHQGECPHSLNESFAPNPHWYHLCEKYDCFGNFKAKAQQYLWIFLC